MNTNNKEAIKVLKEGLKFQNPNNIHLVIGTAIDLLLQDNEDTEVKEEPLLQNNPGHEHLPSGLGKGAYCVGCLEELDKPSSKVEKLKELQRRFSTNLDYGAQWADLVKILNVLIEDEE